jgi:hypothetical protein
MSRSFGRSRPRAPISPPPGDAGPARVGRVASLDISSDEVRVRLSLLERLMALHGDIAVPRDAVDSVEVLDAPLSSIRGVRAPGTGIPGLIAYGTFRRRGGKDFVAVRRGQRAARLSLTGQAFDAIVLAADDPEQLAASLASKQ